MRHRQSDTLHILREAIPNRTLRWTAILCLWFVVGTLSALHWQYFYFGVNPYTWWQLYRVKVVLWLAWGAVTPLILWLGAGLPLERPHVLKHLAILIPISAVITVVYLLPYTGLVALNFGSDTTHYRSLTGLFWWIFGVHSTWFFLAFWATIAIENAARYHRWFLERELLASRLETQLAQTQLEALRHHLQPHFFFNTLHSVIALVRQQRNDAAIEMLTGLSDLLRRALDLLKRNEVPLEEELAFLQQYVGIEKVRFSDRLSVSWDIRQDARIAYVPVFVLQPLVENAIRHGIARRAGPGRIEVSCAREDGQLRLVVKDDGLGMDNEMSELSSSGHGLRTTRARLEALFRDSYRFDIATVPDGGTMVTVAIPFNDHPSLTQEAP